MKRIKQQGAEMDVFSPWWRRHIIWTRGEVNKVKTAYRRRERRKARESIRRGDEP